MSAALNCSPKATNSKPFHRSKHVAHVTRCRRSVAVRAEVPRNNRDGTKDHGSPPARVLQSVTSVWSRLDTQQRAFTVVAGAALVVAAPQLLTVVAIVLERVLVGALLAVEEALAGLLLLSTRLVVLIGFVALVAAGLYVFLFKKRA